ncbi:hypothetical protein ALC57_05243 [Trachymyrmex cornetzi]|uniref:Tesmin/TSO1-like CXC domain-containing protein n=1 Tax=Trachymyrmex cornetzi TaxID=471704 RepID=A0A151JB68_9HYME|nr:hypothetical protein ALC57_05243 [Trachymyrmex cornetzi]
MPIFTDNDLIPDILLKTICCSCETGCNSKKCGCRKHELKCTSLCSNCHGSEKCSNVDKQPYEELSDSEEIIEDGPIQRTTNDDNDDDGLEDLNSTTDQSGMDSDDEEQPTKKMKFTD